MLFFSISCFETDSFSDSVLLMFVALHFRMSIGGAIVRAGEKIGLKQLFDDDSSIYTYLLWDTTTKDAIIVDSVDRLIDRDLQAVKDLDLTLCYGIYTHAPAGKFPREVGGSPVCLQVID